jgi:redox-sensitive bicupin YhaK (pirin superfamily)
MDRRQLCLAPPALIALSACSRAEDAGPGSGAVRPASRERAVAQVIAAQPTFEGAGVRLHRSLGSRALPLLDPFLLLDEIHSDRPEDYIAGFPTHPHRGFETVTYMIDGVMEHKDSLGNHGRLGPGSTQWMTAGHGIVHSEMPQQERGSFWGFQLWVNLPASRKMTKPRYQDLAPERIVELASGDAQVRLVAGELGGQSGPVEGIVTAPNMLDVTLPSGGRFEHLIAPTHNAFAYIIQGRARIGSTRTSVERQQIAVLGPGEVVSISSDAGARLLLLSAQPIGEPVARRGPFVMNTEQELQQAFEDYQSGRLVGGV